MYAVQPNEVCIICDAGSLDTFCIQTIDPRPIYTIFVKFRHGLDKYSMGTKKIGSAQINFLV